MKHLKYFENKVINLGNFAEEYSDDIYEYRNIHFTIINTGVFLCLPNQLNNKPTRLLIQHNMIHQKQSVKIGDNIPDAVKNIDDYFIQIETDKYNL